MNDPVWAQPADRIQSEQRVDPERGLAAAEAERRLTTYGPNELRRKKKRTVWSIIIAQFKSLIVGLLLAAAGVAFLFGEIIEGWAIAGVILINATLGFVTEHRAVRSMEALYRLGRVTSRVRRDGRIVKIPSPRLVPGDVVLIEGGDIVSADLRLVRAAQLQADESALTGESMPVAKATDPAAPNAPLAERTSMLFKGTSVTRGSGEGIVVGTGLDSELGQISELVASTEDERTPLEARLDKLGHKLIGVTLAIAAIVIATGIVRGKELFLMIETGIALAVASIPEGLPIVATIALARGVRRMARRNALINRLSAVETLGSAGVICTDKTGTLTENRMTVVRIVADGVDAKMNDGALPAESVDRGTDDGVVPANGEATAPDAHPALKAALEVATLCNNASLEGDEGVGDPLEVALLRVADAAGVDVVGRRVREEAFDSEVKMMATVHAVADDCFRFAVKGAPEEVLAACSHIRQSGAGAAPIDSTAPPDATAPSAAAPLEAVGRDAWLRKNEELAADGLRVIAVAEKYAADADESAYRDLTFLALVAMADPPREEVRGAVQTCRQAGIRVVMVTGDQPVTAAGIAHAVGLVDTDQPHIVHGSDFPRLADLDEVARQELLETRVFARVSPRQKLDLIDLHQQAGSIVAMTGDGVNDAPALQKADIGIAMGLRGTQVAREASDMVLQDDSFASIVAAVEEGRIIFGNIRRFVFYLLSCNVSEVLVVGLATLIGATLPILPLQILFLNLVTDIFPALALGVGDGSARVMQRPPRDPADPILKRRHWVDIGLYAALITATVLGALAIALTWLDLDAGRAVTISFLTLALAQLWHVFNMRGAGSRIFRNEITRNKYVWMAIALCLVLVGGAVYIPPIADVLKVTQPAPLEWVVILGMSFVPLVVGQIATEVRANRR